MGKTKAARVTWSVNQLIHCSKEGGGGGYSLEFLEVWFCSPLHPGHVSDKKNAIFRYPFADMVSKIHINFEATLQEKLQNSKPAKFFQQNHINTRLRLEKKQSFYSTAEFFVRLVSEKFHFKRKDPTIRRAESTEKDFISILPALIQVTLKSIQIFRPCL